MFFIDDDDDDAWWWWRNVRPVYIIIPIGLIIFSFIISAIAALLVTLIWWLYRIRDRKKSITMQFVDLPYDRLMYRRDTRTKNLLFSEPEPLNQNVSVSVRGDRSLPIGHFT